MLGPACSLVWPLRTSPTVLGGPGPSSSVISIQVTEGHRPPRKGRGRGASGIWLPSHRKDNSRTWIVQGGEFPTRLPITQTRLTFCPTQHLHPVPTSLRNSKPSRRNRKSQRAMGTSTMGSANPMLWNEWEIMRTSSRRAGREPSQSEGEGMFRAPECQVTERMRRLLVSPVEVITPYLRAALLSFGAGYSSLYWTTLCLEEC